MQTKQQIERDKESEVGKAHIDAIPNEVILLADQTVIRNFEVDFGEEEELVLAGGIKGIKALRM